MKRLPIGRDNFKDIIEKDFYYVDKTKIIEELRERGAYVTLFPRPRRFGKSLMISTLDEFFNVEKKQTNKKLFKNLYIDKSKFSKEQGKYPVIKLNFKSLKSQNLEHMYGAIKEEISQLFSAKRYLLDNLNEEEKNFYYKILRKEADIHEYEQSIKLLSQFLEKYYNQKVLLLIDEYDVPIQTAYLNGFYKETIGFIKNLFGNTLKTNDSIEFAVMTGILRVSKESIFSDLNNVRVYSIMNSLYDEYFGFTESETKDLLEYFSLSLTKEVKNMYDGYIFGEREIYNPWSILNYAEEGQLYPYWVNTSSDELLKDLFNKTKEQTSEMLEKLLLGKSIEIQYDDKITFLDLNDISLNSATTIIGNFLLLSGYLTKQKNTEIAPNSYVSLKIPNSEVKTVYADVIQNWVKNDANLTDDSLFKLSVYMLENQKEKIEQILNESLKSMSFIDEHENFYHGYMLGLFVNFLNRAYIVKSNREAGLGRFDVMIESVDRKIGIIVEFKVAKDDEDLIKKAEQGKKQIMEKEYYKELELDRVENILTYSIAFCGKKCKVN